MARLFRSGSACLALLLAQAAGSSASACVEELTETAEHVDSSREAALTQRVRELEDKLTQMQTAMERMQQQVQTQSALLNSTHPARTRDESVLDATAQPPLFDVPPAVNLPVGRAGLLESEIDRRIEAYLTRTEPKPSGPSLSDRLERDLKVYGHVRVRQETDFERIDAPTRNRQRLRARLAADYHVNPEITIGGRFTTGDRKSALDPNDRSGAPLSYQDTGDVFDKFEFNLDRIFVTYSPEWLPGGWLSVGKFKHPVQLNPIFDSPVGDLVWDEAAQPEGIAAGYTWSDLCGLDSVRFVAGESAVLELGNKDDASLFFTQLWAEKRLGCWWKLGGGVTFYNWENLNPDGDTTISAQNNSGNAVVVTGPDPRRDVMFASGFQILNPLVVLTFDDGEGGWQPLQIVGEWFHNSQSFDTDRDFGYTVGAAYGPGISRQKRGDWYLYYAWVEVQQESVFTPVAQDDFLRATNFRGHMLGLAWYPFERVELRLSFLADTPLIPIAGSDQSEWRGRLDVTVGF